MSERPPPGRVGELLGGKYRLVRFLAAGGMGAVYEAQHTVVKRRFAVKLLHPELSAQRESLARFQREAQAAGAPESENVTAALDFGIAADGAPYIVMEYLEGESLHALLDRETSVPIGRAADLVLQACRGIQAAHAAGIIHRDLNPHNLFVCRREDGTDLVKVLDFGIAKLETIDSAETRSGAILGTPAYLSPEQARGEKTVDHRTDVYGLGAVLYELLAGRKPHPGDSHNAILHHVCTQPAVPLDTVRPDLPAPLVALVKRALASDPSQRQGTAEALAADLAPWATREVWPARSPGADANVSPSTDAPSARASVVSSGTTRPRRRRGRVVFAVGAVALLGLALVGLYRSRIALHWSTVARPFAPGTRFFVPPPNPGAIQQIAALAKANSAREAAAVTAIQSTPQAIWFIAGSPAEVRSAVSNTIMRAASDQSIPVLVAFNRPYRDCTGYGVGGATDSAAYKLWIDAFASGIGNERAVVILEPDSVGIIPYNTRIDGTMDWCKPTVTDGAGRTVPAPGASSSELYAQINYAVDSLRHQAPNALVYLDGTHSDWMPVHETAYRLVKSGVHKTQGFTLNVSNFQLNWQLIQYGTWVAKCVYYATRLSKGRPEDFAACATQPYHVDPNDRDAWSRVDQWYVLNVDRAAARPSGPADLLHFVIDTGRNGRGRLDTAQYAKPPYNQPAAVIKGLETGAWCNPPGRGLGERPTAETGVPLLDAYLWIKPVGESDGPCDIAGGVRAWDYRQYNPWGIGGESQRHFDPVWGMVNPPSGTWFPEQALQLAQNANPPLLP